MCSMSSPCLKSHCIFFLLGSTCEIQNAFSNSTTLKESTFSNFNGWIKCANRCRKATQCTHWNVDFEKKKCIFKKGLETNIIGAPGYITGAKGCGLGE